MSAYLTKEQKQEIIATYGGSATNTGSTEAQIAIFTTRIQAMSQHLKENRKDNSCRRALLTCWKEEKVIILSPGQRHREIPSVDREA